MAQSKPPKPDKNRSGAFVAGAFQPQHVERLTRELLDAGLPLYGLGLTGAVWTAVLTADATQEQRDQADAIVAAYIATIAKSMNEVIASFQNMSSSNLKALDDHIRANYLLEHLGLLESVVPGQSTEKPATPAELAELRRRGEMT